jgi:hypothetical protein
MVLFIIFMVFLMILVGWNYLSDLYNFQDQNRNCVHDRYEQDIQKIQEIIGK